jgi:hypothetical protein
MTNDQTRDVVNLVGSASADAIAIAEHNHRQRFRPLKRTLRTSVDAIGMPIRAQAPTQIPSAEADPTNQHLRRVSSRFVI